MSGAVTTPLLELRRLRTWFPIRGAAPWSPRRQLRAVDDVSLAVGPRETLGLVGESGCGKSTLARSVLRLVRPTSGEILFDGVDLVPLGERRLRPLRRRLQMVFQDPADSLNPRLTVGSLLAEPFEIHGIGDRRERRARARELLERVGLPDSALDRFPLEFSGGQRQRIGIARAIALEPRLVVCDEPVSALDASVQAQVVNLLLDLQQRLGLSYLFIAHDLAVVRHVSDRIAVMYLGQVVEVGDADEVYRRARHPYTRALIAAIPGASPGRRRVPLALPGEVPSPLDPPSGCPFRTRCPQAQGVCAEQRPPLRDAGGGHAVACHFDL